MTGAAPVHRGHRPARHAPREGPAQHACRTPASSGSTRRARSESWASWTLTRDDLAGIDPYYGIVVKDQPVVAIDRVLFAGDVVAAVAAEDRTTAEAALDLIEVEYEAAPARGRPDERAGPGCAGPPPGATGAAGRDLPRDEEGPRGGRDQRLQHLPRRAGRRRGRASPARTRSSRTSTPLPMIQHGHIEPHASIASWDASGKLTVYSSTQNPSVIRTQLADMFGLPESSVRVIVPYVGGGYGAKLYPKLEPIAAALARKAGRPVSFVITREEVFMTAVRHGAEVRIKTGVAARRDACRAEGRGALRHGRLRRHRSPGVEERGVRVRRPVQHRAPGPDVPVRLHEQAAGRRVPRLRRPAGLLGVREPDGRHRAPPGDRPGRAAAAQHGARGRHLRHRRPPDRHGPRSVHGPGRRGDRLARHRVRPGRSRRPIRTSSAASAWRS